HRTAVPDERDRLGGVARDEEPIAHFCGRSPGLVAGLRSAASRAAVPGRSGSGALLSRRPADEVHAGRTPDGMAVLAMGASLRHALPRRGQRHAPPRPAICLLIPRLRWPTTAAPRPPVRPASSPTSSPP